MPNTKSAIRRTKKTKKQTLVNKISEAKKYLPEFHSQLMKVAKTGVVSKKAASRKISRITKKISKQK